jgi:histidinol-phosphate aminotransferase
MNIRSLIRKNINELKPYSTARDEFQGEADVYLDANENPYPAPYNRYPDPLQRKLKQKIGALKGISPESMFLGNGSDEAIDLLIRAFCEPGVDSIVITAPTYGMYSVCAGVNNVDVRTALLNSSFDLHVAALEAKLDQHTKLIFLCSPNNPSGNLLSEEKILSLLDRFNGIVVVDEAYIDFANNPGFLPLLATYPNLVILQTLSKAWGLAGLRLGMAFASPDIVEVLNKIKYPYNINAATQHLVLEALADTTKKDEQVRQILEERTRLKNALSELSLVRHIYPSDANFLLVRMDGAKSIYHQLVANRIIVRDRSNVVLCEDCLRITVGTPEENNRLAALLRDFNTKP